MQFIRISSLYISLLSAFIKVNQFNQLKTLKDRQELKNSLIDAQDITVIQILLDLYLLIKKKSNELASRETQCIVCSFIHQRFIENSSLAELVHVQVNNQKSPWLFMYSFLLYSARHNFKATYNFFSR